ncbi:MAG: hypothetical protein LIO42_05025 [Oscillospiraceae bacterium]|nr:hypothetical protein [Oscillospiraceae bacterium]
MKTITERGAQDGDKRDFTNYNCHFTVHRHNFGGQSADEMDHKGPSSTGDQCKTGRAVSANQGPVSSPGEINLAAVPNAA